MSKLTLNDDLKRTPFLVPENYFETFEVHKKSVLTNELKQTPFLVPENYFETFAVRKNTTLAPECKQSPFTVPAHYFDSLPVCVSDRIAASSTPAVVRWHPSRVGLALAAGFVVVLTLSIGLFSSLYRTPAEGTLSQQETISTIPPDIYDNTDEEILRTIAAMGNGHSPDGLYDDAIIHYLSNSKLSLNDIASNY
jgi:hypothetical protein